MAKNPTKTDKALKCQPYGARKSARMMPKMKGMAASIAVGGTEIRLPQALHRTDKAGPKQAFLSCDRACC